MVINLQNTLRLSLLFWQKWILLRTSASLALLPQQHRTNFMLSSPVIRTRCQLTLLGHVTQPGPNSLAYFTSSYNNTTQRYCSCLKLDVTFSVHDDKLSTGSYDDPPGPPDDPDADAMSPSSNSQQLPPRCHFHEVAASQRKNRNPVSVLLM